jgi:hypothetical protein
MLGHQARGIVVLVFALAAAACGGGKGEAKSSDDAKDKAPAIDQLKGLSVDLQGQLDALMAPINEVDALVAQITSMPARLKLNASELMGMFKATADGGQVQLSANIEADAMAKAEVEGVLAKLKGIVDGLKAIPENTKLLAAKAGEALVKVPTLGVAAQSQLTVKASNPFAKPEEKAQAQADLQSLAQIQTDVQGTIQSVQQKVMELPALATSALAKLTASFAS